MDTSSLKKTDTVFCETQWRHLMKTRSYNTPSPILHFVKRSDVTRWKQGYMRPYPPYFIVLASSVKTKEVKVIEFHRMGSTWLSVASASQNFASHYLFT